MSTSKYFDRICVVVIISALILTVLFMNGNALGIELSVDADSEAHSDSEYFTENDQLSDWDTSSATVITLDGDSISVDGNNAYQNGNCVVIANSGRYVISGTLDDGYICVDANANSKVWIMFRGVDISCSSNACLEVMEADKVFLTLAEGTQNTLKGGDGLSDDTLEEDSYGVIYSHDDLTVNGSGSLSIESGYKHGIKANDDLVITGGDITIEAPSDGIHVNDSFRLKDAAVSITAGDDGIMTENAESFFYIESGSVSINSEDDSIHSGGDITISGGELELNSGNDAIHADGGIEVSDGTIMAGSCYEGLEALTIMVSGGDITVYAADDGFNANGGSSDFGMVGMPAMGTQRAGVQEAGVQEAGGQEAGVQEAGTQEAGVQEAGTQEAGTQEAGVQEAGVQEAGTQEAAAQEAAAQAEPESEETLAEPEDTSVESGKNDAAGEAEPENSSAESGKNDAAGEAETENNSAETEETWIRITGGTITIINESGNDADGLDSNGDIYISGGNIRISMVDNGSNSAMDVGTENGGTAVISGGTIIACGSSSMAEAFAATSQQCSILYNLTSEADAGEALSLKDADGNELLCWEVPCTFTSVLISCPQMQEGQTYTVLAGENEEAVEMTAVSVTAGNAQNAAAGFGHGGMQGGQMPVMQQAEGAYPGQEMETEQDGSVQAPMNMQQAEGAYPEQGIETEETEQDGSVQTPMNMGQRGGGMPGQMQELAAQQEEEETEAASLITSYDPEVYVYLLACALVLAAGLVIAKLYRK